MAVMGQCKACSHRVSDEAVVCPSCGQPRPYEAPPPNGSIQEALVYDLYRSYLDDETDALLFMHVGRFKAKMKVPVEHLERYVGKRIKVRAIGYGPDGLFVEPL